jgi:hypothetical protein
MQQNATMKPIQTSGTDTLKKAKMAVDEARMVLPGLQALFGFRMISIFSARASKCFRPLTSFCTYSH